MEQEKQIVGARKKEIELVLEDLAVKKQKAVEKEDFKSASSIKMEILLLQDELDEKNQYLAFLDKSYHDQFQSEQIKVG